jgi:hypothetical protein
MGDIKGIWETSRFDWLIAMAQRAALGEAGELDRLNRWLIDWNSSNPPYSGPNWKCGQEASIRVFHLALAALLLDEVDSPPPALLDLVEIHLRRVAPTMSYAVAQQNNHATSEAAALFIGGTWLQHCNRPIGATMAGRGVHQLQKLAAMLIARDGSFSQHSLNYHRMMLDTYCLAECWRRRLRHPPFSNGTIDRLQAATLWLRQFVNPSTGDGPNLGANDGAHICSLTDAGYRDFRPTLQLATKLYLNKRAIAQRGIWDQPLKWLDLPEPTTTLEEPASVSFDDGGIHVLRNKMAVVYMRYPRFQFRPSQADALHVDLWVAGANLARDAGSFSYCDADENNYFAGTAAHNTVQFDGRDQMPRFGRFLFGGWLNTRCLTLVKDIAGAVVAEAGYRDIWGAEHHRSIRLEDCRLICSDLLSGTAAGAVLRWRLAPGDWRTEGCSVTNGVVRIKVEGDYGRLRLLDGWESPFYGRKFKVPIVEVELGIPAKVTTVFEF